MIPMLAQAEILIIDLDGTDGYGSSFLEEAFGGLVRLREFSPDTLRKRLRFVAEEDDSFVEEIWGYVDEGAQ